MQLHRLGTCFSACCAAALLWVPAHTAPKESDGSIRFDVPAGGLDQSLREYARQADLQVLYSTLTVKGKKAAALHGNYTPSQAAEKLIQPSGLHAKIVGNVVVIYSEHATTATSQDFTPQERIIASGTRTPLDSIVASKRALTVSSDTLFADNMETSHNQNATDALRQISGTAESRANGEGRQVTVRGLGPQFTQVQINGMEALATAGSSPTSGANRGRAFDFNVFAAEIFDQFIVLKSSSAEIPEGSLGVTINMRSGHPFDNPVRTLRAFMQYGYNDLSRAVNPRVGFVASDVFLGGRIGLAISGAFSRRSYLEQGYSTIRHTNDNTDIGNVSPYYIPGCNTGAPPSQCVAAQRVGGVVVTTILPGSDKSQILGTVEHAGSATTEANNYDILNEAFRARFPRYDLSYGKQHRLGLTFSAQWQMDQSTLISFDALFSSYADMRNEYYLENNSFANDFVSAPLGGPNTPVSLGTGNVVITDYTLNTRTNTVTTLTGNGFGLRDEASRTSTTSRFGQASIDLSHDINRNLKIHGFAGWSESRMRSPLQMSIGYDYNGGLSSLPDHSYAGVTGFRYDFSNGYRKMPGLYFGNAANADGSVTALDNWFLSQIREWSDFIYNDYRVIRSDIEWSASNTLTIKMGVDYRNYGYSEIGTSRSDGTIAIQDYNIPSEIRSSDLAIHSKIVALRNSGAPAGSGTTFIAPDISAWLRDYALTNQSAYGGIFRQGVEPVLNANGSVNESTIAGWVQASWATTVHGIPVRGDAGLRILQTQTNSSGYAIDENADTFHLAHARRIRSAILPAMNLIADISDASLLRLNIAQTLARPSLTNILPSTPVVISGANRGAFIGNPDLKPHTSENIDLSYEYYYRPDAMLSLALFYKHIDTLEQTVMQTATYRNNPFHLPISLVKSVCGTTYGPACNEDQLWQFRRPQNVKGHPLYGTEVSWRQPIDIMPSDFGTAALDTSVTFVEGRQTYYNADGTIYTRTDLIGLSRISSRAALIYNYGPLETRITSTFRSRSTAGINTGNLNTSLITASRLTVDVSGVYQVNPTLTLTFAAQNITGEVDSQYTDPVVKRPYNLHQVGRDFVVGLRYRL